TRCLSDWSSDVCSSDLSAQCRLTQSKGLYCGIERHLGAPELFAEYVQEFHGALAELRDTAHDRRAALSKQLDEIEKSINAIVDRSEERRVGKECRSRVA